MQLLIVPYGIEIVKGYVLADPGCLLIVPYGIEIPMKSLVMSLHHSFNRTLWN